ncbi:hypothetical protein VT52_021305 [Streptomyces malaysiense]|uniref:Uncharacterized protein n=1 Tax=Streptomyces malaysiense TaxID=1428626 RepID=A0A1J4PZ54_9ACTN|nr:hypothetical protein VT52_021305 [Streptomyces malaysiense]
MGAGLLSGHPTYTLMHRAVALSYTVRVPSGRLRVVDTGPIAELAAHADLFLSCVMFRDKVTVLLVSDAVK